MTTQTERAQHFASLHVKGSPLILYNIWDAGSAKAIAEIGAKALATGSWSVASADGYADGQKIPLDAVVANLARIVASVDLPVSLDFEGGYGQTPDEIAASVRWVIGAGAVGVNFEDRIVDGEGLYSVEDQAARIAAMRAAADSMGIPFFINARSDVFLQADPATHGEAHLDQALTRMREYAKAGASGFFAPGLRNATLISDLCAASTLPVNILVLGDTPPPREMAALGVSRISYGAGPYREMIAALKEAGRKAIEMES